MSLRPKSLPDAEQYDGAVARFCDFCGIGTGSTEGNFEAFRLMLDKAIKACAAAHGTTVINGPVVHGKGRLGFEMPKDAETMVHKRVDREDTKNTKERRVEV